MIRIWKVYGAEGHRQRESFSESYKYDFSEMEKNELLKLKTQTKPALMNIAS